MKETILFLFDLQGVPYPAQDPQQRTDVGVLAVVNLVEHRLVYPRIPRQLVNRKAFPLHRRYGSFDRATQLLLSLCSHIVVFVVTKICYNN